jgi:hypothetical protein
VGYHVYLTYGPKMEGESYSTRNKHEPQTSLTE